MAIPKPFKRTARATVGGYKVGGFWQYTLHPDFAVEPDKYVRSYLVIEKDFRELLEYVEPADENERCFSIRIHSLLLRACVEFEANCRAILLENNYTKRSAAGWTIKDFNELEPTHGLSHFEVKVPGWRGKHAVRTPFAKWGALQPLTWYQGYNDSKHNRHDAFAKASFENLVDAICGLQALLSAQFIDNDFSGSFTRGVSIADPRNVDFASGVGGFFGVKFPTHWSDDQLYGFNWDVLSKDKEPMQTIW